MNKRVLITGASSGIGRATAKHFAAHNYNLILCGRRLEKLQSLAEEIQKDNKVELYLASFDIRNQEEVQAAVELLPKEWQSIDILVNNAGLALGMDDFHEANLDHWNTMIDTNVKGLLYMSRAISPMMVERKSGQIINVCSTAGHETYPKGNVYSATKHAVMAITKSMRLDLHKHNIRVSQVSPGMVEETEFSKVRFEGDEVKANIYTDFNPLTSSDVAEIIYFMASRPPHVNIQDILVMGTQQASSTITNRNGRIFD